MEVILLEKVGKLGGLGDKVTVKSGFGRNFLVPYGKAVPANAANIAEFEARRAELEKAAAEKLAGAQARAEELNDKAVTITSKAGDEGKLFGSVTNANIAEALEAQGFSIEKSKIRMPQGQLKQVGDHPIIIALHSDVNAHITVSILGETTL